MQKQNKNSYSTTFTFHLPVYSDGHEGEHAGWDGAGRNELCETTVVPAKGPVAVEHVNKVEECVHDRDEGIRNSKVHQEVVGDSPHPFMSQDYPYDNDVAPCGHNDHRHKNYDINKL